MLKRPAVFLGASVALMCLLMLTFGYRALSYRMFAAVWNGPIDPDASDVLWFTALTEPMGGRYAGAYDRAVRGAWKAGLTPPHIRTRQTNLLYGLSWHGWQATGGAAYWVPSKTLFIHSPWGMMMSDEELICVFSHEIGHALQDREGVLGPDFMCGPHRLRLELEADETAARICGPDAWSRFFARHIRERTAPACP